MRSTTRGLLRSLRPTGPITRYFLSRRSYVMAAMLGRLGNRMFEVAAAMALAWDHRAEAYFPELPTDPEAYAHVLFRCRADPPPRPIAFEWHEPSYAHHPIDYRPDMKMVGYFQSEKYFAHHRQRLLDLFTPRPDDWRYIQTTYRRLIDDPSTVGVQIRHYRGEFPQGSIYPQYGRAYLERAMATFPRSARFVVSSDDLEFARAQIPSWVTNTLFLEREPAHIALFLLSLCRHHIISNSSFGWWSAWLGRHPGQIVVRPGRWVIGLPDHDVCPDRWVRVDAPWDG